MLVVVLGHRLVGPSIHPHLRRRVDRGIEALREANASSLLCSGGRRTDSVSRSEAEVMAEYARDRGVPAARLLAETRSVDTIGNAYFSRRLVDRTGLDPETIQLVTSADHVDRAAFVFERCFAGTTIETDYVAESAAPRAHRDDDRRMRRTRAFFEPIEPGDLRAIERRLRETHDCYGPGDVAPDGPVASRAGR